MKIPAWIIQIVLATISLQSGSPAQVPSLAITPEQLQEPDRKGFQADPKILQDIATVGRPLGRWKEGLMFDGIEPIPWLKSSANWTPGKEKVQKKFA